MEKTINTIKFAIILAIAAIALGFCCPCGAHAQSLNTETADKTTVELLEEGKTVISEVKAELAASKARLAELEAEELKLEAEIKAESKSKNHIIQLTQGENVLEVKKSSAGFFSASVSNRTFATVNQGYVTLKAGKNIKRKLFAKAKCAPKSKTCEIKIYVNGPGSLVYGNLYRIFGYENLAVRQVFKIGEDLKVSVPKSISLKAKPEA